MVTIPGFKWKSSYKPEFTFVIKDTHSSSAAFPRFKTYMKRRTTITISGSIYILNPRRYSAQASFELQLATKRKWLGTGMDDIYEHRIKPTDPQYLKAGVYHFVRSGRPYGEDPLENVMNDRDKSRRRNNLFFNMPGKKRIRLATTIYWLLLFYMSCRLNMVGSFRWKSETGKWRILK